MPDLPASWVADPDKVTFAIWALAGSVVLLGGIIVAGLKWIASNILSRIQEQLTEFKDELRRVANSLEHLNLTTSVQIAEIKAICKSNHHE